MPPWLLRTLASPSCSRVPLRLPLLLYWLLRKPARIVSVMAALGLR